MNLFFIIKMDFQYWVLDNAQNSIKVSYVQYVETFILFRYEARLATIPALLVSSLYGIKKPPIKMGGIFYCANRPSFVIIIRWCCVAQTPALTRSDASSYILSYFRN